MNTQTRQLVGLLVDDVTPRIVQALRGQPQTIPALARATGASQNTVGQNLELLLAHGVVDWRPSGGGTRGRPSRIWELTAADQLDEFERACEELKAALLPSQLPRPNKPSTSAKRRRR